MKLAWLLLLAGCQDALDQRLAIVASPRMLAVASEPPEVMPGQAATLSALVAAPTGPLVAMPTWALCAAPKPPTEDNAVADGCLADAVIQLGTSPIVTAPIPADACRTFGPDVADPGFRPRDADATGGYYQPIRAEMRNLDPAFGFTRITCNLANAPGDVAQQYKTTYVANANPTLLPLALDGVVLPTDGITPAFVTADHDVTLVASWPAEASESFLYYDPDSQRLITRHETIKVSWFATAGALDVDASAVDETSTATSVTTNWHTPTAGPAWLWLVLRDSRGGVATATYAIVAR